MKPVPSNCTIPASAVTPNAGPTMTEPTTCRSAFGSAVLIPTLPMVMMFWDPKSGLILLPAMEAAALISALVIVSAAISAAVIVSAAMSSEVIVPAAMSSVVMVPSSISPPGPPATV